jgi:hypothetical protein
MESTRVRSWIAGVAIAGTLGGPMSGCYAESVGTIPPPEYAYGYAPVYYDGYVVYYDDLGRPFYYVNGGVQYVPQASPFYLGLVAHWRTFGPHYHDWHVHAGERYRAYRFHGHRR